MHGLIICCKDTPAFIWKIAILSIYYPKTEYLTPPPVPAVEGGKFSVTYYNFMLANYCYCKCFKFQNDEFKIIRSMYICSMRFFPNAALLKKQ